MSRVSITSMRVDEIEHEKLLRRRIHACHMRRRIHACA
jgi:hypothetical protein